jgi:mannose-6-phosphate isomerase-like protein (cupin superfamily)
VALVCDSFAIIEWTDPGAHPGLPVAGLHVHREDDEAWYVVEGRLGFRVGDAERVLCAGESILVGRGTAHTWWNAHAAPTHYLLVTTPRIHHLIEALHASDPAEHPRIFAEHASELVPDR